MFPFYPFHDDIYYTMESLTGNHKYRKSNKTKSQIRACKKKRKMVKKSRKQNC